MIARWHIDYEKSTTRGQYKEVESVKDSTALKVLNLSKYSTY